MNAKDLMIFAGVAIAAYWLLMRRDVPFGATEIRNPALPGQTGYGWRYFSDGTAIAPNGTRYSGGAQMAVRYDGVSVGANYGNLST